MKYKILMLLLLIVKILNAQEIETLDNINFFNLKTDYDFEPQKQYEKIAVDGRIIAFRRFQDDQFAIAEEYIHLNKDTYLFREYAGLEHRLVSSGKVVPSICCGKTDTTYIFDSETYEEKIIINRYWDWSREGVWKIESPEAYEYGNYKNNLKVGEWHVWDKNTNSAKYVYFDDFGAQLFEEPQDLTKTNNKERIKQGMIGIWRIVDYIGDRLRLIKEKEERKVGTYGSLVFSHIDVKFIKRVGCGTGFNFEDFKKRCINDWALDDGNILSMQVYGFEDKKYKITYLSRYEMCLMLVR
jgi:hypothetical protein